MVTGTDRQQPGRDGEQTGPNGGAEGSVWERVPSGVLLLALVRTPSGSGARSARSDFDRAFADMSRRYPSDSGELSLVHDVQQSVASSFHLHTRLRPILSEIAAHRLSMRFGVDLDREHERARELIGGEAWELVRPGRPFPSDRLAPGPPASHLSKVVAELERI